MLYPNHKNVDKVPLIANFLVQIAGIGGPVSFEMYNDCLMLAKWQFHVRKYIFPELRSNEG